MEYRILGPLEALDGERRLSLGGTRQRAVLALLLLHGNEALTRDVIVDELWGESPPQTSHKVLQNCISALRKELPGATETLRTVGNGYVLQVGPDELDRDRFERGLAAGRAALAAGDSQEAGEQLREALALWRGFPLSDFAYERFAQDEIARLDELHVTALEDRIEADLALGRHTELVSELEALVARHPVRERLRAELMLALYRSGRQAEALSAYRDARRAGSGKTRLGDEIASRAKAGGARILWGRGWGGGGAPRFWPWIQALRDAGHTFPEPAGDDDGARFRTFETVTELLRDEAKRQPLLLVLDDLQAADTDSLLLIEFLASELPEMAMLMLALGRDETPRLDELGRLATQTLHLR